MGDPLLQDLLLWVGVLSSAVAAAYVIIRDVVGTDVSKAARVTGHVVFVAGVIIIIWRTVAYLDGRVDAVASPGRSDSSVTGTNAGLAGAAVAAEAPTAEAEIVRLERELQRRETNLAEAIRLKELRTRMEVIQLQEGLLLRPGPCDDAALVLLVSNLLEQCPTLSFCHASKILELVDVTEAQYTEMMSRLATDFLFFDSGGTTVEPDHEATLSSLKNVVTEATKVIVIGRASPDGDTFKNRQLADARARNVGDALVRLAGVPSTRIFPVSYGEETLPLTAEAATRYDLKEDDYGSIDRLNRSTTIVRYDCAVQPMRRSKAKP
jgi:outer membrane protein OmpA-like peptidoglycan-associated protein